MEKLPTFSWPLYYKMLYDAGLRIARNYVDNISGYHHDSRDILLTYTRFFSKVMINPHEFIKIQGFWVDYLKTQQVVWEKVFVEQARQPLVAPKKRDRRFQAKEWGEYPWFNFARQNYLLFDEFVSAIINEVDIGDKTKRRLLFYSRQYLDMLSPANFLFTNPEALRRAAETNGESLWAGFIHLMQDIENGRISQTDESAFEVGRNLALTPGSVIYENKLMQLIQYAPSTSSIYESPLLIIPPWINKYYILDLQQKNSFVKFLVDKGISVYMISWRNPAPGEGNVTFDEYVSEGAHKAIEVAKQISGAEKINALGYCLGGTLLSVAAAVHEAQNKEYYHSLTFLASMVDFSDIGPMGDVIDAALVKKFERGELLNEGVFHGHDMERAFNLIRVNDLVWNYVVSNYLKGMSPEPVDVMYWTNDNTNLPAGMYTYYMRKMVLENQLSRKNALFLCNTRIDVGRIKAPAYIVSFTEDHIAPAKTGFTTTALVSGPAEFILGGSGHVMGAVNPPSKNKYGYYTGGKLNATFEEWRKTAEFHEGSWWTYWTAKLQQHLGRQVPSLPKEGNADYPVIEKAPGRYVKEKHR